MLTDYKLSEPEVALLQIIHHQQSQSDSQFISQLIALMYLVDREVLTDSLQFEKTKFTLNSSEVESLIQELENHGVVYVDSSVTFGGDTRNEVYITENGVGLLDNHSDTKLTEDVVTVCEEYGEIPISNLVSIIRESENSIDWLR